MTGSEAKDALMDGRRVACNGIEYDKLSAIIYRNKNGKVVITAEVLDMGGNSVTIAPIENVKDVDK